MARQPAPEGFGGTVDNGAAGSAGDQLPGRFERPPDTFSPLPGPTNRTNKHSQQQARELTLNAVGSTIPAAYGRVSIGAQIFFFDIVGGFMYIGAGLCWGESEEFEAVYINDQLASVYTTGVTIQEFVGTPTQSQSTLLAAARTALGDLTFAERYPGLTYIVIKINPTTVPEIQGIPDIKVTLKARKIYDPRTATTVYSENPYLVVRDLMTNDIFGGQIPTAKMNDAVGGSIRRSADYADVNIGLASPTTAPGVAVGGAAALTGTFNYKYTWVDGADNETTGSTASSDVTVTAQGVNLTGILAGPAGTVKRRLYRFTVPGGTGYFRVAEIADNTTTVHTDTLTVPLVIEMPAATYTKARWKIGIVLNSQADLSDWIQTILAHAPGWITFNGKTFDIIADQPDTAGSVYDFTDDDILADSMQIEKSGFKDSPNAVTVKYTDTVHAFIDASARRELATVSAGTDYKREATYSLPGTPDGDQAQRQCIYYLNRRLADVKVNFQTPASIGIMPLSGDLITVTWGDGIFTASQFRVMRVEQAANQHVWSIEAVEYTTTTYVDYVVEIDPGTQGGIGDPFGIPGPPTGVTLTMIIESGTSPPDAIGRIRVDWVNGVTDYYDHTEIEYNYNGVDWIQMGDARNGPVDVDNVLFGVEYTFNLYTRSATGQRSVAATETIIPGFVDFSIPEPTQFKYGPSLQANHLEFYGPIPTQGPFPSGGGALYPAPTNSGQSNAPALPFTAGTKLIAYSLVHPFGESKLSTPLSITVTTSTDLLSAGTPDQSDPVGFAQPYLRKYYMTLDGTTTPFYYIEYAGPATTAINLHKPDADVVANDLAPELYDGVKGWAIYDAFGIATVDPVSSIMPLFKFLNRHQNPHRYNRVDLSGMVHQDPTTGIPRIDAYVRVVRIDGGISSGTRFNQLAAIGPAVLPSVPSGSIHAQITLASGANHDVQLPDADYVEIIGPSADFWATGFQVTDGAGGWQDPVSGRIIKLVNKVNFKFSLKHQDTGSSAASRIRVPGDDDYEVGRENASVTIEYDHVTDDRWIPIAFNFAGAGPIGVGGATGILDHWPFTDPTLPSWAWYNQGSAGVTVESDGSITLIDPATTDVAHRIRGREIAAPSAPFTISAAFCPALAYNNLATDGAWGGVYIRDSVLTGVTGQGSSGFGVGFYTGNSAPIHFISRIANPLYVDRDPYPIGQAYISLIGQPNIVWTRLYNDGTDIYSYFSTDGWNWVQWDAQALNPGGGDTLVIDKIGFFAFGRPLNVIYSPSAIRLLSWEVT